MSSELPSASGRYRFISRLASGGMAEVFRAVLSGPEGFEKPAVVKRMLPELARQDRYRQMFIDEARLMASLSHRNVVAVLDFGQADGSYFIALEYVDGVDLGRALRARPRLAPALAIHLCECVLRGLSYVHSRRGENGEPLGIVHRDVSPQNVLLGRDGDVKLGDFGIAKGLSSSERTRPGTIKGKVPYISPEQARAAPLDGRSDLFSVGVMLYEALLGRRPFEADNDVALLQVVSQASFSPPLSVDPALDPALAAVLTKALAREPADRYANADELAKALLGCARGAPAGPHEVGELVQEALAAQAVEEERAQRRDSVATDEEPFGAALRERRGDSAPARGGTSAEVGAGRHGERGSVTAALAGAAGPSGRGRGVLRWAGLGAVVVIATGAVLWSARRPAAETPRAQPETMVQPPTAGVPPSAALAPTTVQPPTVGLPPSVAAPGRPVVTGAASAATAPPVTGAALALRTVQPPTAGVPPSAAPAPTTVQPPIAGLTPSVVAPGRPTVTAPAPTGALSPKGWPASQVAGATSQSAKAAPRSQVRSAASAHPTAPPEPVLEPAKLDINATPWARVEVDGVFRGVTPVRGLSLPPGRHVLLLRNPLSKQQATLTVDLKSGEARVLPVNLDAPVAAP